MPGKMHECLPSLPGYKAQMPVSQKVDMPITFYGLLRQRLTAKLRRDETISLLHRSRLYRPVLVRDSDKHCCAAKPR